MHGGSPEEAGTRVTKQFPNGQYCQNILYSFANPAPFYHQAAKKMAGRAELGLG